MSEKLKKAIEAARLESTHIEREKRVELESLPADCKDGKFQKIRQGFIREIRKDLKPHADVRVRETMGQNGKGKPVYSMTAKYRPDMQEAEMTISKEIFDSLWEKTSAKQLKNRYSTLSGWLVDEILKPEKRFVAEYEYSETKKQARVPKTFIKKD